MADTNPFGALASITPTGLRYQREADLAQQNQGLDYWAQSAGRSGLDLRNRMLEQGKWMTPEDRRALQAQTIMSEAQMKLGELVKSGEVDPLDAQESVVSEVMAQFMSVGDYEAAQSMLPALNHIRTYKGELAKLRSEEAENRATQFKDMASGKRTLDLLPSEIAENEAQAEYNLAGARLKDRTDPNIRKGGGGDSMVKINAKDQADIRALGSGTLNMFSALNDLSQYMTTAPRAASAAGQAVNTGQQYLAGFQNMLRARGASMGGFDALSSKPEDGVGASPKEIVARRRQEVRKAAVSLGMDVTAFESLVIDAAYSIARTNDPGGRLSNNDFDYALKMLGAVQDAESAKGAFRALAERGYEKFKNKKRSYPTKEWEELFGELDAAVEADWGAFNTKWGKSQIRADAAAERQKALDKKYGLERKPK